MRRRLNSRPCAATITSFRSAGSCSAGFQPALIQISTSLENQSRQARYLRHSKLVRHKRVGIAAIAGIVSRETIASLGPIVTVALASDAAMQLFSPA
jgi:hypothetical protein